MAQWTTHASTQHEQISITDSAVCLRNSTGPRAQSSNCGVPSCCIAISRRQTSSSKDASRCDECRASVGKVILSNQPHSIAFYSSHHQGLPVKYAAVPFGSTFPKQEIACIATYQVRQREKKPYRSNLSHRDERSLAYLVLAALTDSLPFLPHSRAEIHLMLTFLHFFQSNLSHRYSSTCGRLPQSMSQRRSFWISATAQQRSYRHLIS